MYSYSLSPRVSISVTKDVEIDSNTLADKDVLQYDAAQQVWTNVTRPGLGIVLTDLADIGIDSEALVDGQFLRYNATDGTWDEHTLVLDDATDVVLTDVEEFQVLEFDGTNWVNAHASLTTWARNVETTTLNKGEVVYIFGGNGDHATVKRADKDSGPTVDRTIGMVATPAPAGENCVVVTHGYVKGLNLSSGYAVGDKLWVGDNGGVTTTRPVAPAHSTFVGVVIRATNNGIVFVSVQQGDHLEYLHDVLLDENTLADGDVLTYDDATGLWVNAPSAGGGGAESLDDLSDATITSTLQWPGPFVTTTGTGAPTSGTGNVGEFYIDFTNPAVGVLYGPKQPDNTWPSIGNQAVEWTAGGGVPVNNVGRLGAGKYFFQVLTLPPSLTGQIWGPYTDAGVGESSVLSYNQSTRQWTASNTEVVMPTDGGNWAAQQGTVSGNYTINPQVATYFLLTLTANGNFGTVGVPRLLQDNRAARITIALQQGGSGGYTVTWPSSFKWPGGVAPTLSTAVGEVDIFEFVTFDRGLTWYGASLNATGGGGALVQSDFVDPYSYIGVAPSGSATSASVWNITRIEMDTGFPVTIATGVAWDDRLTETYS